MTAYFDSPLAFYEDENATDLRAEYVRLMAKWRDRYTALQVCQYIFGRLRDPDRYVIAAQVWEQDLELTEQIDQLLHGTVEGLDEEKAYIARLEAIADLNTTPSRDKIKALELAAQIKGMIKKQVEKTIKSDQNIAYRYQFVEDID